jgi:hypothetical protein
VTRTRAENGTLTSDRLTHCSRGHEFTPANTRTKKSDGSQVCRECVRVRRKTYKKTPWSGERLNDLRKKHRQQWMAFPSAGPEVARSAKRRAIADRKEFVNSLKDRPCTDCGGRFHSCAMDFDHLDGHTKVASISEFVSGAKSKKAILAEVAKCELVCSNCHRVRTFNRANSINRPGRGALA